MAIQQTADLVAREREWVAAFLKHGLPYVSACAATGNVAQENEGRPVTLGQRDDGPHHDGKFSDGGFQWRGDRLEPGPNSLKGWCAAKGLDWKTIDAQAQFFLWECQQFYGVTYAELMAGTKPLATLTANIMERYERPAAEYAALDNRIDAAQYCFDNFHDLEAGPPVSPPAPTPVTPAPPPAPPVSSPELERLMAGWRLRQQQLAAAQLAVTNAQKAIDDARGLVDAEIVKIETDLAAKKKELG